MKLVPKMPALVLVALVGLVSVRAEAATSWWSVDFETGYTVNKLITAGTSAAGEWSSTSGDTSVVTAVTSGGTGNYKGKLDTQGGILVWTPDQSKKPVGTTKVLISTDIYLIGLEVAPAASDGTVQTAVYLANSIVDDVTNSTLCAFVGDGTGSGTKWVELEHAQVTFTDQNWINLRIEIDYDAAIPKVSFKVGEYLLADTESNESFDVAPTGANQDTVTDVTFLGDGYFDNFVGIAGTVIEDGGMNENGQPVAGSGSIVEDETAGTVTATFSADPTPTEYIQMTGPGGFVQTVRTSSGVAAFSTAGLAAGTYSITAYYGTAPTVIPEGYKPAAEASGENKAAEVAGNQVKINVAPVSGLYYTLFAGDAIDGLKASAASTLADPDDEDAGFLQISMPVPDKANEVKIIKIVASDEPYAAGDTQ